MDKSYYIITGTIVAMFVAVFGIVVFLLVGVVNDLPYNSYTPPENLEAKYHMVVSETVETGTIKFENYVSVNTLDFSGESFAEYNEGMSEEYYLYNRYYVDNVGYQEENDSANRYFYGTDLENPEFVFEVATDYKKNEWFVNKDYVFPVVGKDEVIDILLIDSEQLKGRQIESSMQRVDVTKTAHVIEDEAVKKQVLDQFLSGDCMFYESVFLYSHPDKPAQYLILAKFKDSVVYQCVGYQME